MDFERGWLLPLPVNLLITPVVTGFVGYFTNFLAIKMLFRPHRRRWYSLGWQGVIPRNRSKLASEVGEMVGRELVSETEIRSAVGSDNFQALLERAVSKEMERLLSKNYGNVYDIGVKLGIPLDKLLSDSLTKLMSDDGFTGKINQFIHGEISKLIDSFLSKSLSDFDGLDEKLKIFVQKLMQNGNWQDIIVDELSASMNNVVLSGKSLKDILPNGFDAKVDPIADVITDKAISAIDKLFEDPTTRKVIAKKLMEAKDNFFENGLMDSLKTGFISMFLTEEVITGVVDKELPNLIDGIKTQPEIREKLKGHVSGHIHSFLEKPLYSFASTIGIDTVFEIRSNAVSGMKSYLKSDGFTQKVESVLSGLLGKYSHFTIGGILNTFGIKPEQMTGGLIDIRSIVNREDHHQLFSDLGGNVLKRIELNNVYEKIPEKSFEKIKINFVSKINQIMEKHIPSAMQAMDLPRIVEDKINHLDLYEVESLLFSFMKDQFKWINVLGFILGFIFGAIQSLFFYFMN